MKHKPTARIFPMCINEFVDAISSAGLGVPDIIADGELHRFPTLDDKHRDRSGWYVFHGTAGAFGDWRTGLKQNWSERGEKLTAKERKAFADMMDRAKRKRAADERQKHLEASTRAQAMLAQGAECMWHQYLKAKRVLPLGLRQHNDLLLVAMIDTDGAIWNLQTIDREGNKRFLRGGRKKGLFHQIGGPIEDHFYIVEGWATGATIHMHMDRHAPVFVAFDAGNLRPVAVELRKKYPGIRIVIAADNDAWKDVNVGVMKGREAAAAVDAELIYPIWENVDTYSKPTDFNDLYHLGGL